MKYTIPTTTAIIGALALLTTGCENYRSTRTTAAPGVVNTVTDTAGAVVGAPGYVISKITGSTSKTQAALKRARDYYAQLSDRDKAMLQKRKIYCLAVEVPGYRNRGTGVPVLVYDIRGNRLVSDRIVFITHPLRPRQVMNLPREVSNIPGCRCQFIEYIGVGAPLAYP